MNKSVDRKTESVVAKAPGTPPEMLINMPVASPQQIGLLRGAWEMLQNPELLSVYAQHYHWEVHEHHGILIVVKRLPGVGILKAQVFSPESCLSGWSEQLLSLPAGSIVVQSNHAQDLPVVSRDDTYSFILDLQPDEEMLFQRMQKRSRKAIRKATKEGLTTHKACEYREVRQFYELANRVTKNGSLYHVPPLTLLEALLESGHGHLYLGYLENNLVGGIYVLSDHYAHGLLSAYDTELASGIPSNMLLWHTLLEEKRRGIPFFDFGAQSLDEHPQLTLFKRSFSPTLVPAFRYQVYPSKWRSMANRAWDLQRRLRGKP